MKFHSFSVTLFHDFIQWKPTGNQWKITKIFSNRYGNYWKFQWLFTDWQWIFAVLICGKRVTENQWNLTDNENQWNFTDSILESIRAKLWQSNSPNRKFFRRNLKNQIIFFKSKHKKNIRELDWCRYIFSFVAFD